MNLYRKRTFLLAMAILGAFLAGFYAIGPNEPPARALTVFAEALGVCFCGFVAGQER